MAEKEVVDILKAEEDVTAWLDLNGVSALRRQRAAGTIDILIEAVQYGNISIAEDGKISQTLKFAVKDSKGDVVFDRLSYAERINTDAVIKEIGALKVSIPDTHLIANIAVLTDRTFGQVSRMMPADMNIAKSIGIFFMS